MKCFGSCAVLMFMGHLVLADDCLVEIIKDPVNQFKSKTNRIPSVEISNVMSLVLGMSTEPVTFKGLLPGDPFHRPSASVTFVLELIPRNIKTCFMPQHDSISLSSTRSNILDEFDEEGPVIVDYTSSVKVTKAPKTLGSSLSSIPSTLDGMFTLLHQEDSVLNCYETGSLNMTQPVDLNFVSELQLVKEVFDKVSQSHETVIDSTPDLYSFALSGLRKIQDVYGTESQKTKDAHKLMNDFLDQLYMKVESLYNSNVLITLVKVEKNAPRRRKIRDVADVSPAPTGTPPSDTEKYNLAPNYPSDYPVMFNIILWLVVILTLAIIGISYMLGSMDPGDTIIYRMTSQRIKID